MSSREYVSSREYARDYVNGWNVSERCSDGALDRADLRGVSDAWYDGYHDSAAGRPKWAWRDARRKGCDPNICDPDCAGHLNEEIAR